MFQKLDKRVIIDYKVITESDLHIGGSATTVPGEVDLPVIKNSEGYPIIPGSSLKGVLRNEMSRFLLAVLGEKDELEVRLDKNDPTKTKIKSHAELHVAELFGGECRDSDIILRNYASSIKIRDAVTENKRTVIRDHVKIDPKKRKAMDRTKFDLEAVPKGILFEGKVIIENPDINNYQYAKLGALLATINFFNATNGTIGGGGSRGYGQVRINIIEYCEFTAKDFLNGNEKGSEVQLDPNEIIDNWKNYVNSLI